MTTEVVIQMGHCFRERGFTGTAGWGHTEQEFVAAVGRTMTGHLWDAGVRTKLVTADETRYPPCRVFVALHQDGSTNGAARGASVGYPASVLSAPKALREESARAASIWKAYYQGQVGWPSGFRADNYSSGLRRFYMWRPGRIHADAKFLIEHGFATNQADQGFMWRNLDSIARANADALMHYLGVPDLPSPVMEEDEMPHVHHDTTTDRSWLCQGNRARPMRDGSGRSTGKEYAERHDLPYYPDPNARYIVDPVSEGRPPGLYDIVA